MSTVSSAEQLALRGLLLIVVEVQNLVRSRPREGAPVRDVVMHDVRLQAEIAHLVEAAPTVELVQLARAALATRNPRTDCTCPFNGVSSTCPAHGSADHRRAIPAAVAGVHA